MCGGHDHHIRPCGFSRTDADRRIFKHQTILHRHAQALRAQHITGWVRLTDGDIFSCDQHCRGRNTCRSQSTQRQLLGRGRHQRPLIARQAVQKCNGTGNRYDPFDIIELSLGNPLSLNLRINAGQCLASDGIDRASTVNGGQKSRHIQAVAFGPNTPHPLGSGDGIEQGPIHIE